MPTTTVSRLPSSRGAREDRLVAAGERQQEVRRHRAHDRLERVGVRRLRGTDAAPVRLVHALGGVAVERELHVRRGERPAVERRQVLPLDVIAQVEREGLPIRRALPRGGQFRLELDQERVLARTCLHAQQPVVDVVGDRDGPARGGRGRVEVLNPVRRGHLHPATRHRGLVRLRELVGVRQAVVADELADRVVLGIVGGRRVITVVAVVAGRTARGGGGGAAATAGARAAAACRRGGVVVIVVVATAADEGRGRKAGATEQAASQQRAAVQFGGPPAPVPFEFTHCHPPRMRPTCGFGQSAIAPGDA